MGSILGGLATAAPCELDPLCRLVGVARLPELSGVGRMRGQGREWRLSPPVLSAWCGLKADPNKKEILMTELWKKKMESSHARHWCLHHRSGKFICYFSNSKHNWLAPVVQATQELQGSVHTSGDDVTHSSTTVEEALGKERADEFRWAARDSKKSP